MGSYVRKVLTSGEAIIHEGKLSLWSLAGPIILGGVLLPVFGIGLVIWLGVYIRYISTELAITNKRVIAKFGFIVRSTVELNIRKVESIQVNQGILGRIFNYGSIVIAGAGTPQAPIPGISQPLEFRSAFIEAQDVALESKS